MSHDLRIQESSWINTKIFTDWVTEVLAPHAKKLPPGRRGLLMLMRESRIEIKVLNYDYEFLLPDTTAYLRPLDIGVNQPFKDHCRALWED